MIGDQSLIAVIPTPRRWPHQQCSRHDLNIRLTEHGEDQLHHRTGRDLRGLLLTMAKSQRPTTCVGCGEPVQAVVKQGVSSGVRRRTRHVEPVAELALRCRFDGGPDPEIAALEPYPGDVG